MDENMYIVPSPTAEGYVALARTLKDQKGRLFRKQIFKMNSEFANPNDKTTKITIDEAFAKELVNNFATSGNIVQVPVVNDKNEHVEDPDRNVGEVLGLEYNDKGIYAVIDARKNPEAFGKTYIGASAMFAPNYTNTATNTKIGNTLLHVGVTNRPYLTDLEDYEEIMGLSADINTDDVFLLTEVETAPVEEAVVSSTKTPEPVVETVEPSETENTKMTREELIAAFKELDGTDVVALEKAAADLPAALSAAQEATVSLSGQEIKVTDLANSFVELSDKFDAQATVISGLTANNEALKLSAAETEIDGLISEGRILPAQKAAMLKLSMNDRETFDAIVPAESIVKLSAELGVTVHEEAQKTATEVAKSYAERAVALNSGRKTKARA